MADHVKPRGEILSWLTPQLRVQLQTLVLGIISALVAYGYIDKSKEAMWTAIAVGVFSIITSLLHTGPVLDKLRTDGGSTLPPVMPVTEGRSGLPTTCNGDACRACDGGPCPDPNLQK